jgi:hypothetical protein
MDRPCRAYLVCLAFVLLFVTHLVARAEGGEATSLCTRSQPDGEKSSDCAKTFQQVKVGRALAISGLSLITAGSVMAGVGIPFGICMENCDSEDDARRSGMLALGVIGAIAAATGYGLTFAGIGVWTGGYGHVVRLNHQAAAAGHAPPQFAGAAIDYYAKRKKIGMGLAIPGFILLGSGIGLTGFAGAVWAYRLLGAGISFLAAGAILSIAGGALWIRGAKNKRLFETLSAASPAPVAWYDRVTKAWCAGIRTAW